MNNNDELKRGYGRLDPDLWPRRIWAGFPGTEVSGAPQMGDRSVPPPYLGEAIYLSRGLSGYPVTVGTTPVKIIESPYAWPHMILNPASSLGITASYTGYAGTVVAAGNSQANPIGVSSHLGVHMHMIVTAVTGVWDFYAQSLDPVTLTWVDTQAIFTGINAVSNNYATLGSFGVVTDLAFRWNPTTAGSITFSLSTTLKAGPGASEGLTGTVYLGPEGVTTVAGYPLMAGNKETFVVQPNTILWGVAATTVTLRVFIL